MNLKVPLSRFCKPQMLPILSVFAHHANTEHANTKCSDKERYYLKKNEPILNNQSKVAFVGAMDGLFSSIFIYLRTSTISGNCSNFGDYSNFLKSAIKSVVYSVCVYTVESFLDDISNQLNLHDTNDSSKKLFLNLSSAFLTALITAPLEEFMYTGNFRLPSKRVEAMAVLYRDSVYVLQASFITELQVEKSDLVQNLIKSLPIITVSTLLSFPGDFIRLKMIGYKNLGKNPDFKQLTNNLMIEIKHKGVQSVLLYPLILRFGLLASAGVGANIGGSLFKSISIK